MSDTNQPDPIIRAAAEVLIHEQSNGLCRLDRRCDLCDCQGDSQGYALDHAQKVVAAVRPLIEAEARLVTPEQVEAAAEFAYRTDWAAARTARNPFSDPYTADIYRRRVVAILKAAGCNLADAKEAGQC